jgi:formylglycine-generating enzyme required for sulfatase activity
MRLNKRTETRRAVGGGLAARGAVAIAAVLFATTATAQAETYVLPSSAYSTGAGGAEFHSDVRVLNVTRSPVTVTPTFYDQANGATVPASPFTISARSQASFDNILRSLFGAGLGAYGPIRFEASGAVIVSSSVNNVNACGTGATSGQWLPGIDASQSLRAGIMGQLALSSSPATGYRTNIVFMNPGTAGATVTATLRHGDGSSIGTVTYPALAADGFRQVSLGAFPGASGTTDTNLFLEFTSDQPVLAFASVINNSSGDPFAIVATADTASQGMTVTLPGGVPLMIVKIPHGTFLMGSPAAERNRQSDETQHQVTISADYFIGETLVTQAQWQAVMGSNPSYFSSCGGTCPVEEVSWNDIAGSGGFLEKLNAALGLSGASAFRLPTEAEWEQAARGGTTTRFWFGDALDCDDQCGTCSADPYLWWCGNPNSMPRPVGQKQPSPYGLYDVHGNVSEWVQDWYAAYPTTAVTDPTGGSPQSSNSRVNRGGGWDDVLRSCRSAYRGVGVPDYHAGIGFRIARSQ